VVRQLVAVNYTRIEILMPQYNNSDEISASVMNNASSGFSSAPSTDGEAHAQENFNEGWNLAFVTGDRTKNLVEGEEFSK
jgi:hypothetical protein